MLETALYPSRTLSLASRAASREFRDSASQELGGGGAPVALHLIKVCISIFKYGVRTHREPNLAAIVRCQRLISGKSDRYFKVGDRVASANEVMRYEDMSGKQRQRLWAWAAFYSHWQLTSCISCSGSLALCLSQLTTVRRQFRVPYVTVI